MGCETVRPVGGIAAGDGLVPMEVDQVNKGKGQKKGKGKGKGKDQLATGKGKDKGKGKPSGKSQHEQHSVAKEKRPTKERVKAMVALNPNCWQKQTNVRNVVTGGRR